MEFAGRTVLVTGAGRGIGRALAGGLAARGAARILAVGRDAAALAALARERPAVEPVACDLADAAAVEALVARVTREAPELSVLVNNAGVQVLADLVGGDAPGAVPALDREIAVNFTAVVSLTCGLLPLLLRQERAMVVNVTSGLALAPKRSSPVYCATKAGVRSFTKALRYQAAGTPGLLVVEALPPLVDTDMTHGRGRGKISAERCAAEILDGMARERAEVFVGKAKLLRAVMRLSPALGERIMRDG